MNRFGRLSELFAAGVDLPSAEQERLIVERCGDDASLAREARAILAVSRRPLREFELGAGDLLERLRRQDRPEELCGTVIGEGSDGACRYEIEEHMASGGMAHVYRAARTIGTARRRVALKVLREDLDSAAFLERFEHERATLARLEHELIVTFLDAGSLPDGRPFLVMEYVEGVSAIVWANSAALSARIVLLARIAEAIQYAHTQLVVHRDLKPSNVLVLADGTPRLLDFGIATILDERPSGDPRGAAEQGPMTPAYASPEQLTGAPVTAASDVFALGRLLEEVVAAGSNAPEPGGDLRAIIARATAIEPVARYPSAGALAADLRRILAHEPVHARPAGRVHRARLFARRRRLPIAAGAAIVLALIAGWASAHLGKREAQAEASLGWGAHTQARRAANAYERSLLALAADSATAAATTIDRLQRELSAHASSCPETEVLLRLTLAELLLNTEEPADALVHAERAAELAETSRGVGSREAERATNLAARCRAALRGD
ncbi:MAG: serine/threonine protein kinase [bacterium]|nr:serine/threonine protein kinase [bacterium]